MDHIIRDSWLPASSLSCWWFLLPLGIVLGFWYLDADFGFWPLQEGELRPQLLDRFGLSVSVGTLQDADLRTQMVLDRMAYDRVSRFP